MHEFHHEVLYLPNPCSQCMMPELGPIYMPLLLEGPQSFKCINCGYHWSIAATNEMKEEIYKNLALAEHQAELRGEFLQIDRQLNPARTTQAVIARISGLTFNKSLDAAIQKSLKHQSDIAAAEMSKISGQLSVSIRESKNVFKTEAAPRLKLSLRDEIKNKFKP